MVVAPVKKKKKYSILGIGTIFISMSEIFVSLINIFKQSPKFHFTFKMYKLDSTFFVACHNIF
jgi:Na+/phosphate symporter